MSTQPQPNVADSLLAIHAVITRGLQVSLQNTQALQQSGFPDPATQEGFTNYVQSFSTTVHGHHGSEDEIGFPYFKDRLPEMPVERLSQEHQVMVPLLEDINAALEKCRSADQVRAGLEQLAVPLRKFSDLWGPHIQIEESYLTREKLGSLLPVEEHLRLIQLFGEYSQMHALPPFLTVPFALYNLPPETRALMVKAMPPEVTEHLVPVVWKEKWQSMAPFLLE